MKLLFFSDVHGVPSTLERLFEHADALKQIGRAHV